MPNGILYIKKYAKVSSLPFVVFSYKRKHLLRSFFRPAPRHEICAVLFPSFYWSNFPEGLARRQNANRLGRNSAAKRRHSVVPQAQALFRTRRQSPPENAGFSNPHRLSARFCGNNRINGRMADRPHKGRKTKKEVPRLRGFSALVTRRRVELLSSP